VNISDKNIEGEKSKDCRLQTKLPKQPVPGRILPIAKKRGIETWICGQVPPAVQHEGLQHAFGDFPGLLAMIY
jgi:hypothetical protein